MKNKLILNLRLEVGDQKLNLALTALVLNNLKQLEDSGIAVEYFELRLSHLSQAHHNKMAYIKIDANDRTFIDSETSSNWDTVIQDLCERLRGRFINCTRKMLVSA